MDLQTILAFVVAIVTGIHVKTIVGLILLDVVLGIAEAVKEDIFDFRLVADFYRTMVLPYILAFVAFVVAAQLIAVDLLGPLGYLVSEGALWAAWLAIILSLGGSILGHLKALAIPLPELESNRWHSEP